MASKAKAKATQAVKRKKTADKEKDRDVCAICLDQAVHPVRFDCCGHEYCFLCAKGLMENHGDRGRCSLCRKPIPNDFLEGHWKKRTRKDLELSSKGVGQQQVPSLSKKVALDVHHSICVRQWFYEGRDGWWKFEVRHNQELEEAFQNGLNTCEALICGHIYVIDFTRMIQFRKDSLPKKRRIKRDVIRAKCKGVAGMVLKK